MKRDVLNFSICGSGVDISLDQPNQFDLGSCQNPIIEMIPLILGGQAGYSGGDGSTTNTLPLFAADQAERGATLGGFKFKYAYFDNGYINTAGPDNTVAVTHVIYSAIVKQEYDLDAYRTTGSVGITKLPNIVGGTIKDLGAATSFGQPIGDVNATDILWRDIAWVRGRPLDSALFSATPIQEWQDFQYNNKSQTFPWNFVKVKRRLNENEGLFWVTNVVTGLPQFSTEFESAYVASLTRFVYGIAAAKLR